MDRLFLYTVLLLSITTVAALLYDCLVHANGRALLLLSGFTASYVFLPYVFPSPMDAALFLFLFGFLVVVLLVYGND